MLKLKIRCFSKNTGEIFYEYYTKTFFNLDDARKRLAAASYAFFNRLSYDLVEDCTFEVTVLHCREELPLDFQSVDVEDYNKNPVVF